MGFHASNEPLMGSGKVLVKHHANHPISSVQVSLVFPYYEDLVFNIIKTTMVYKSLEAEKIHTNWRRISLQN